MLRSELVQWLRETDPGRLESLWSRADAVRREHVGDEVHLRGLIEISNHCARRCAYCGLRAENRRLQRYRMTADEIVACARQALTLGYGTVVLQSGEDPGLTPAWVAEVVRRIKAETGLAVTLSLGEQTADTLCAWRRAGADRYLLRFETSNRELFERIHPPRPGRSCDRIAQLRILRDLDYEVGSGVMVGIPGQSYEDLADDIELFRELDLDMIGVGPWLPHPDTPLGGVAKGIGAKGAKEGTGHSSLGPSTPRPLDPCAPWPLGHACLQVPNTELMTYKVVALARLVCPRANIPSTTALATLNRESGRELGLQRGANVIMPNLTPAHYRRLYEIYPAKACLYEEPQRFHADLVRRIESLGRIVGRGPGASLNWQARRQMSGAPSDCLLTGGEKEP